MAMPTSGEIPHTIQESETENFDIKPQPDLLTNGVTHEDTQPSMAPEVCEVKAEPKICNPLAANLPPELADCDVRELFPEFRPGHVLRFSRLFKPTHLPHVWRRKKKKKIVKVEVKLELITENQTIVDKSENRLSDVDNIDERDIAGGDKNDSTVDDVVDKENWCCQLNWGRSARPEEMMEDDKILFLKAETVRGRTGLDSDLDIEAVPKIADWRYGPAQLWYDMLGVDDSGEGFDYGFKKKQSSVISDSNNTKSCSDKKCPLEFPEGAFQMVTQMEWEDEIIWNAEDVKQKVMQSAKLKGASAGWIPSSTARTIEQYRQVNDQNFKVDSWYSLFPAENSALVYGNWEDDVIWDASAMEKIPEPTVLTLDPDDENLILEIPEDHAPTVDQQELVSTKKKKVPTATLR